MRPYSLILRKREGGSIPPEDLRALLRGYHAGQVPDYQMAAFLMAVHFRGMDASELRVLVEEILASGRRVDFGGAPGRRVDKHSTGGVGDKVSLVLAPLVASLGVQVPMMSGRGLGHSGGTVDKLETIPGFRLDLSLDRFRAQVLDLGVALITQTPEIAPLDGRLYALRDVTATVESIPLIAASIMSKKIAEGLDALVLDVKAGNGAFIQDDERTLEVVAEAITLALRITGALVELTTQWLDGWDRDVFGVYRHGAWHFELARNQYPHGLDMKLAKSAGAQPLRTLRESGWTPELVRQRLGFEP